MISEQLGTPTTISEVIQRIVNIPLFRMKNDGTTLWRLYVRHQVAPFIGKAKSKEEIELIQAIQKSLTGEAT